MATLEELEFQQRATKNVAQNIAGMKYQDAAKQASDLFLQGRQDEAINLMMQTDPNLASALFQSVGISRNTPQLQTGVNQDTGKPEIFSITGAGKATGTGVGAVPKASQDIKSTYQVRNPLLGTVEIRDRATGELIAEVGTPSTQSSSPMAGSSTKPIEETQENLDPKQLYQSMPALYRKKYEKYQTDFFKDSQDDRDAYQAANKIQETLASGQKLDGDILRFFQNNFARASGEKGAMTDRDVAPFGGRQSVLDRIERNISVWSSGKIPEGDREFLTNLAQVMQKANENSIIRRSVPFASQIATSTNLSEAQAGSLLLQGIVDPSELKTAKKKSSSPDKAALEAELRRRGLLK